ncbi:uncharacterized protein METZ01_LOCUS359581, partial [marine metagenome]
IDKIEDFKGQPLRCNMSPIATETFIAVGADPHQIELEEINEGVEDGRIVGGESTYPRFYGLKQNEHMSVINDAEHSLFLTSILVAKDFWKTLDDDLKEKIEYASFDAARSERQESVEDISVVKARCVDDDIAVHTMAVEERVKFQKATEYLYDKFEDMFSVGLINKIKACH